MRGRPRTTGRFETRADLVERVRSLYYSPNFDLSMAGIARNCHVGAGVVDDIIVRKEWETLTDADSVVSIPEGSDIDVHLDSRSLTVCGSGYDFPLYVLHIPDRIKRDLDIM